MSATYNWAYKPGVTNKYGFTIPAGADNVRPTGFCYVALYGNDSTGNGSRQLPYKTLTRSVNATTPSTVMIVSSGVYREATIPIIGTIIGDGDVIIDCSFFTAQNVFKQGFIAAYNLFNIKLIGDGTQKLNADTNSTNIFITDCIFDGVIPYNGGFAICAFTSTIVKNLLSFSVTNSVLTSAITNCTFYNIKDLVFGGGTFFLTSCVVANCNVTITSALVKPIRYSLFFNCNFRFAADNGGGNIFPSLPAGFTYLSTIAAINAALSTAYPTSLLFTNCFYGDPLFNNPSIGDFSLQFGSPAKNLSYSGTFVGAQSIAYPIKVSATEATGNFDFSTNINLILANDSITLANTAINAEIKTKLIVNVAGRQISKLPMYGFNADRNGQYIDSIPDLDTVFKNAGDTLSTPTPYLVENGALTYNGNVYQPGDRLTTVPGVTVFTTTAGGTLREILEAPERHTVMMRCGNGSGAVTAGTALTAGYWYYVSAGSVVYDTITYNAGQSFKAIDTNAFSGSGNVILALSTEAFQHYEPGIAPTSNNVGNAPTGAISVGNGDPSYNRGGLGVNEFTINAMFIQLYYTIKVANLTP